MTAPPKNYDILIRWSFFFRRAEKNCTFVENRRLHIRDSYGDDAIVCVHSEMSDTSLTLHE